MNLAFGGHLRDRNKIKAKSVLEPSAHPAGVYLSFLSMKRQEVLQLSPWMGCLFIARLPLPSSISSGFPNSTHDRTHLIILQGRGKYCENKVFCPKTKHINQFKSPIRTSPPGIQCTDYEAIASLNPLTPMSDQERIPPYNINTISNRQVMRITKNISLRIF